MEGIVNHSWSGCKQTCVWSHLSNRQLNTMALSKWEGSRWMVRRMHQAIVETWSIWWNQMAALPLGAEKRPFSFDSPHSCHASISGCGHGLAKNDVVLCIFVNKAQTWGCFLPSCLILLVPSHLYRIFSPEYSFLYTCFVSVDRHGQSFIGMTG